MEILVLQDEDSTYRTFERGATTVAVLNQKQRKAIVEKLKPGCRGCDELGLRCAGMGSIDGQGTLRDVNDEIVTVEYCQATAGKVTTV